jgi:FtsZ-binding cell division protein ZapB
MVTLEQVRQLEAKIGKAIEYVNRVKGENVRLQGELDGSQKRIAELEETIQRFREDQGRIEEGILAALDRLDQFEDNMSQGFSNVQELVAAAAPSVSTSAEPTPPPSGSEAPVVAAPPQDAPSDEEFSGEELLVGDPLDGEPSQNSGETGAGDLGLF